MSGREGADAPMEQRQNGMRQPPYSADAERSVLGSMLLETNALEIALEQLRPEDFYLSAHEAVFACMRDIRNGGGAVDLVTLVNELERHGKLDMAGGAAYLSELLSFVRRRPTCRTISPSWRRRASAASSCTPAARPSAKAATTATTSSACSTARSAASTTSPCARRRIRSCP